MNGAPAMNESRIEDGIVIALLLLTLTLLPTVL